MLKVLFVSAIFLLPSVYSHAELFVLDYNVAGDGLLTYDDATRLEWLDVTVTAGASYDDVSAELGVGGLYEGWSYATADQFEALLNSIGGSGSYDGADFRHNAVAPYILSLLGSTFTSVSQEGANVLTGDCGDVNECFYRNTYNVINYFDNDFDDDFIRSNAAIVTDDEAQFSVGSLLVRTSEVPVPAGMWLFGSALMSLAGLKRKK